MQLLSVELKGFKSFAHKTTFHVSEGLTAIIGPNGSGKSNFTEAIRWVLGEQSLKTLRGRKSDDVIFAGSGQRGRSGSAEVTLVLSNEEGRLPVDAAEVAIARRITRNGESEYLLNGDPVRLQDIQQLLAEAGIGTKSYTVISQGTVDRYLNASPAARRELFDEATGIKALQLKVSRAQRQLAQAQRDADAIHTVLHELAPRLRVLKKQVQREEERTTLLALYTAQQAAWFIGSWHTQMHALTAAHAQIETQAGRIAQARQERERVEATLLQTLTSGTPVANSQQVELQTAVQHAQQAYREAMTHWQEQRRERDTLNASLQTLRIERQRAEDALAVARRAVQQHTVFQTMPTLLQRCHALLRALAAGQLPETYEVTTLEKDVEAALRAAGSEQQLVDTATAALRQLEAPLQTVARLQALEQDRTTRLAALAEDTEPSPAPVEATRLALARYQEAHAPANAAQTMQGQLDQVRSAELVAEREGSAAQAAYAHAKEALDALEREIRIERGTEFLSAIPNTPAPGQVPALTEVQTLAARISALGEIDPLALQEYKEVDERYHTLEAQLRDIETSIDNLEQLIVSLQRQMQRQFKQQFMVIQEGFARYFTQLFEGGDARLEIVETPPEDDPELASADTVSGVEIYVHPPGKKLQHIQLLSGGEKALTSLALLFAILEVQQPPFLVLDEVDAALDEANSHRFATLLRAKSAATQCIVVSHNRETMGQADILYGIAMQQDGVSKAFSVKMSDIHTAGEEMGV